MPGVRDKIIINGGRDEGNHAAIMARFKVLRRLGKEVQKRDLLKQAKAIRNVMANDCATFNKAQRAYCDSLDQRIDELDALINSVL